MAQILEVTAEQAATFTRQKTRAVKEVQTNDVDVMNGDILRSSTSKTLMTSTEPDYIKIYYNTVLAFNGINDIPVNFIMAMSGYISWVNDHEPMVYRNDRIVREQVCKLCSIKEDMYHKYITRCVKNGLLVKKPDYRGVYEVNPFFIAKGRWDDIKELRATFDFVHGQWSKHMEVDDGTGQD